MAASRRSSGAGSGAGSSVSGVSGVSGARRASAAMRASVEAAAAAEGKELTDEDYARLEAEADRQMAAAAAGRAGSSAAGSQKGGAGGGGDNITDEDVEHLADRMSLLLTSAYGQDGADTITENLMQSLNPADVSNVLTNMKATQEEDVNLIMYMSGEEDMHGMGLTDAESDAPSVGSRR